MKVKSVFFRIFAIGLISITTTTAYTTARSLNQSLSNNPSLHTTSPELRSQPHASPAGLRVAQPVYPNSTWFSSVNLAAGQDPFFVSPDGLASVKTSRSVFVLSYLESQPNVITHTLSVNITGNGQVLKDPSQPDYLDGQAITLTAVADPGWTFANWGGDLSGLANPITLTMDTDKIVSAVFNQDQYTLFLGATGSGSIAKDPDLSSYIYGDVVTMTATPDPGWSFAGWSGDIATLGNPTTITITSTTYVTATFSQDHFVLTTAAIPSEGGAVAMNPDQPDYLFGEDVVITATGNPGWSFLEWNGDLTGNTNPDHVIMNGDLSVTAVFTNTPPNDISLSSDIVAENQPAGTTIGTFTTTDQDVGDTFTYALAPGSGADDNTSFIIAGSNLQTNAVFNFETKNSYSIRVRSTDSTGNSIEKVFSIRITNVNEAPTNLALSSNIIAENRPISTTVGILSTTDPDAGSIFTYTLATGDGSSGNNDFAIISDTLRTDAAFNYENKNSYNIRVRVTDPGGLYYEKQFTVHVTDLNEAPTDILLSNSSIAENLPGDTKVGDLTTIDQDASDNHGFSLAPGLGSVDNASFAIISNTLRTAASFDYETKNSYNIRVRTTDNGDLTFEKPLTITVTNVNEKPVAAADHFLVSYQTPLTITAAGVLENDTDEDQDPLTAVLDQSPAHDPQFQLNPDGSFVYVPEDGFLGIDTIKYHANDGSQDSNIVTVDFTVYDGISPEISWKLPVGNEGIIEVYNQIIHLEVIATDNVAVNSVRFYRWDPNLGKNGDFVDICTVRTEPYACDLNSRVLNLGYNQIFARATDTSGNESGRVRILIFKKPGGQVYLPVITQSLVSFH